MTGRKCSCYGTRPLEGFEVADWFERDGDEYCSRCGLSLRVWMYPVKDPALASREAKDGKGRRRRRLRIWEIGWWVASLESRGR